MSKDLTAQDIKRIRRKYGLTQQGFARLLGLGEESVVRYENGQTPSKANANLIRCLLYTSVRSQLKPFFKRGWYNNSIYVSRTDIVARLLARLPRISCFSC